MLVVCAILVLFALLLDFSGALDYWWVFILIAFFDSLAIVILLRTGRGGGLRRLVMLALGFVAFVTFLDISLRMAFGVRILDALAH